MLFVVLVRNRFGVRDAWFVEGEDLQDAMSAASDYILQAGVHHPRMVTILPAKENRTLPFLFPDDPDTDTELMVDFLRGHIQPVFLDGSLAGDLYERRKEHSANAKAMRRNVPLNMVRFQTVNRVEQTKE